MFSSIFWYGFYYTFMYQHGHLFLLLKRGSFYLLNATCVTKDLLSKYNKIGLIGNESLLWHLLVYYNVFPTQVNKTCPPVRRRDTVVGFGWVLPGFLLIRLRLVGSRKGSLSSSGGWSSTLTKRQYTFLFFSPQNKKQKTVSVSQK